MTIDRRDNVLRRFIAWCSDRGLDSVDEITSPSVSAYRRLLYHYRNDRNGKYAARR